jgi:hypothetical protein
MLIGSGKYKKMKKKKCVNSNSTMLFCSVFYQTSPKTLNFHIQQFEGIDHAIMTAKPASPRPPSRILDITNFVYGYRLKNRISMRGGAC